MLVVLKKKHSHKAVKKKIGSVKKRMRKLRSHKKKRRSLLHKKLVLKKRKPAQTVMLQKTLLHQETIGHSETQAEPVRQEGDPGGSGRARYDEGFDHGYYEGGEAVLTELIPAFNVLPEISMRDVLKLGFEHVRHQLHPLVDPFTIFHEMQQAIQAKQPMSIVRLGDGEILTLAHDVVISAQQASKHGAFLPYAGVRIPDAAARDQLAHSIRQATIIGIPTSRMRNFQGLLFPTLRAHGIDYRTLRMTISTINYLLYQLGYLTLLLENRRVLLVGNEAPALAPVLASRGFHIAGVVTPVRGIHDSDRVLQEIAGHQFDIALIAAGIPAVVIAQRVATELGGVALDFGHLADKISKGEPVL